MRSQPLLLSCLLSSLSVLLGACASLGLDDLDRPGLDTGTAFDGLAPSENTTPEPAGSDGTGGGDPGSSQDGGASDPSGGTGGTDAAQCTHDEFPVLLHQATQDWSNPSLPLFVYQARTVERGPFDELQIVSYQGSPYDGPSTAGTYSLEGSNYADCALCLLIVETCTDGYQCDRVFFADEGVLSVQDFGQRTGRFTAELRGTVFQEVQLDPATHESTPVPGGDTYCVDGLFLDVAIHLYP